MKARHLALVVAIVLFALPGAAIGTSPMCRWMPSWGVCAALPQCTAVRVETVSHASWRCDSRLDRWLR